MGLSKKQKELSLRLFGSDRLTRRQFNRAMEELKEASCEAFVEANESDMLDLASSYSQLKKVSMRYHAGPCPMAGCTSSDDGFFVDTSLNIAACRRCQWQENGQGAGPVGFIANKYTLSAHEARDYILGRSVNVTLPKIEIKKRTEKVEPVRERQDFSDFMQWARENLASSNGLADWGYGYFSGRGIAVQTINHFGLGVLTQWGKPLVALPFYSNEDRILCGVRLRGSGGKWARKSVKGSTFQDASFGLDTIVGHQLAVITEGGFNALSIWQTLQGLGVAADVLSVGSEGALKRTSSRIVQRNLKAAKSLIVWADKVTKGDEVRQAIARVRPDMAVIVLHSKEVSGKKGKTDANDLLLAGHLSALMRHVLPMIAPQEEVYNVDDTGGPIEQENELSASEELLYACGVITEQVGTEEALKLYREAEDLYMDAPLCDLFAHYEKMEQLTKQLHQTSFDLTDVKGEQEKQEYYF